jgi:tetratricopeptide (TPR) repeat protein
MSAASPGRAFVGRLEVLDELRRRADRVRGGVGGLTLVEGEAGVGKSTLITELVTEARAKGMEVLVGRSAPFDDPPPLYPVRAALESHRPPTEESSTEEEGTGSLPFVPPSPSDMVMIGFAPRLDSADGRERWDARARLLDNVGAPSDPGEGERDRLFASLADQFLSLADRTPTLVVLDNVHRADESTLDFLEFLAPQVDTHPLWIVATALPFPALAEPRRGRLERLARAPSVHEVHIRPFTANEVADFVRQLTKDHPVSAEDITRWVSRTGGNPLFIEQLVRTRADHSPAPPGVVDPTPATLVDLLEHQVRSLSEEEHRVMTVASILGPAFDFSVLLRASGEDEERLAEITERLVSRGILRERANEELEFVRDDLRSEIYSTLTDTRRRLLHRRAGEAIEATGAADVATVYALARHFHLGKVDNRAAEYNRFAAEIAAGAFSYSTARQHLEVALESHRRAFPEDAAGDLALTMELAVTLNRLGELGHAENLLREAESREALTRVATPVQRAFLRISLARVLTEQGRWDEAEKLSRELVGSADVRASPETLIAAHRLRGEILYYRGDYRDALADHDAALKLAREQNDERQIAMESVRRANVLGMLPERHEEALEAYQKASEELRRLGDNGEAAYALLFRGIVLSQCGRAEEGLKELREALRLAELAHDARRAGWALFDIADLLGERGELQPALEQNRRAREILERIGDRFGLIQTMIIQGKLLLKSGDTKTAEIELLDAYRLVRELNASADELDVQLRLAEVALANGDASGARARTEELERRGLARVRPDLVHDLQQLRHRLDVRGAETGAHA